MAVNIGRYHTFDTAFTDLSNVFVELKSPTWRLPMKMSLKDLSHEMLHSSVRVKPERYNISNDIDNDTLYLDPSTLKVKVKFPPVDAPEVFYETFNNQDSSYYIPPKSGSRSPGLTLMTDENYLYIWVGNRWKRTPLSEWEDV